MDCAADGVGWAVLCAVEMVGDMMDEERHESDVDVYRLEQDVTYNDARIGDLAMELIDVRSDLDALMRTMDRLEETINTQYDKRLYLTPWAIDKIQRIQRDQRTPEPTMWQRLMAWVGR